MHQFHVYFYPDIQDLCEKLKRKDNTIKSLQEQCQETVTNLQQEQENEKTTLQDAKNQLERDLELCKYVCLKLSYFINVDASFRSDTVFKKKC